MWHTVRADLNNRKVRGNWHWSELSGRIQNSLFCATILQRAFLSFRDYPTALVFSEFPEGRTVGFPMLSSICLFTALGGRSRTEPGPDFLNLGPGSTISQLGEFRQVSTSLCLNFLICKTDSNKSSYLTLSL